MWGLGLLMYHGSMSDGWEKAPERVVFSLCEAEVIDRKDHA